MTPGPKRKPTVLKKLDGDIHKERWTKNEPQPKEGIPTCPAHLTGPSRTEWRRITKELSELGLLTNIDRAALAAYCSAYGRWVKAERAISRIEDKFKDVPNAGNGLAYQTSNGNWVVQPLVSVANKALEMMHKFLTEFGMTPASRSRIDLDKGKSKEDELDEFLNTGKMN